MIADILAAEWLKTRSVRSNYYLVAAASAVLLLVALLTVGAGVEWDNASPESRARFVGADPLSLALPLIQFCLAVFGIVAATSEYATGTIRASLVAVPRRAMVVLAKAPVVAAVGLVAGQLIVFATFFTARWIRGDRHNGPLQPVSEALGPLLSSGVVIMVICLVGLGLGAVLRSTVGALLAVAALLFVVPGVAGFLPAEWADRVSSVSLSGLASELAGGQGLLSPWGAAAVLAVYVVGALGAGALVISRRDA